jgi:hypothetical protein
MQCHIAEAINLQINRCRGLKTWSDGVIKEVGRTLMLYLPCIMLYIYIYISPFINQLLCITQYTQNYIVVSNPTHVGVY